MNFNTSTFRNDEIELLRAGEVADAGVGDVGRFVCGYDVVPRTHFFTFRSLPLGEALRRVRV